MNTDSINCPSCGAPLALSEDQTLAVCLYCNSSIRVAWGEKPGVAKINEIKPEVVDEVKRLLVIGLFQEAVDYYTKQAGVDREEAHAAVKSMKRTIGYKPPLNIRGLAILAFIMMISIAGIAGGAYLAARGTIAWGAVIIAAAVIFASVHWFIFNENLKAYFLLRNGIAADAVILKSWQVLSYKKNTLRPSFRLMRLLLEIRPKDGPAYRAEANCLMGEKSEPKFAVGSTIQVKYDRKDREHIAVAGTSSQ